VCEGLKPVITGLMALSGCVDWRKNLPFLLVLSLALLLEVQASGKEGFKAVVLLEKQPLSELKEKLAGKGFNDKDAFLEELYAEQEALVKRDQERVASLIQRCGGNVTGSSVSLNAVFAYIPTGCAEKLEASPLVKRVFRDVLLRRKLDSSECSSGAVAWHSRGYHGIPDVKVSVIDTGVDSSHPNIRVSSSSVFHGSAQTYPFYADNASSPDDFQGHGTHVAGIINSNHSTYTGVAPGASLINAKAGFKAVTPDGDEGLMFLSDAVQAIDWAVRVAGADVVSFSF